MTIEDRKRTKDFLYKGHRFLGRLFTLNPPILFLVLSGIYTALLFIPAGVLRVHLITLETSRGPRAVGLLQNLNWSLMYPVVLPLVFAGTAWSSNEMRKKVEQLTDPEVNVIRYRSAQANDYIHGFVDELAKSGKPLVIAALTLTVIFSIIDVANIVRGSHEWFAYRATHPNGPTLDLCDKGYPFKEPDVDWTVAFTLKDAKYQYAWFPCANLAFDCVAYLLQGAVIFLGLFWAGKFFLFMKTFVALIASQDAPYLFVPMRRDFHRRLGLGGIGRLFNCFCTFVLIFQFYVFFHRLQIVARGGGMTEIQFIEKVYDKSKDLDPFKAGDIFKGYFTLENLGMWLLLGVTTIVVIWTLNLIFSLRSYLESQREALWGKYRADLDGAQNKRDVGEILGIESDMKELRESTTWINGDTAGPRFAAALVLVAVIAWLPPILAYAVPAGVLAYFFPPLKSVTGKSA